jgi:hypothetical protein
VQCPPILVSDSSPSTIERSTDTNLPSIGYINKKFVPISIQLLTNTTNITATSSISGSVPAVPVTLDSVSPSYALNATASTAYSSSSSSIPSPATITPVTDITGNSPTTYPYNPTLASANTSASENFAFEILTATDGSQRTTTVTWVSTLIPAHQTVGGVVLSTPSPAWACSGRLCNPKCIIPVIACAAAELPGIAGFPFATVSLTDRLI